jgi:hypothetical protein
MDVLFLMNVYLKQSYSRVDLPSFLKVRLTHLMLEPMKMTHEAEEGKGPLAALF